jgi:uncharacterized DUF497 family protein
MEFEWDSGKADANLHKHGISFEDAARVFSTQNVSKPTMIGRIMARIGGRP